MVEDIAMKSPAPWPGLRARFAAVHKALFRDVFDDYRPELHYMRGPGPKWREKHPSSAAQNFDTQQHADPLFPGGVPA